MLLDFRHEPKATPVECVDDPLGLPRIAHRLARRPDAGVQRGLADELLGHQLLQQLLLGDEALTMRDEVGQYIEDLGPELDQGPGPPQLIAVDVEAIVAKSIIHRPFLPPPQGHAPLSASGGCRIARKNHEKTMKLPANRHDLSAVKG
jgi:hypothetical protein